MSFSFPKPAGSDTETLACALAASLDTPLVPVNMGRVLSDTDYLMGVPMEAGGVGWGAGQARPGNHQMFQLYHNFVFNVHVEVMSPCLSRCGMRVTQPFTEAKRQVLFMHREWNFFCSTSV